MSSRQTIFLGIIAATIAITWGSVFMLLTSSARLGALAYWMTALLWMIWFLITELTEKKKRSSV